MGMRPLSSFEKTPNTAKKTLVITGGSAQMGPGFIKEGQNRGYEVVSCSRRIPAPENQGSVNWVNIKGSEITSERFWVNLFQTHCSKSDKIAVVNTIGASVAPIGQTLEEVNEKIVSAVLGALNKLHCLTGQDVAIAHISSICATLFPTDAYSQRSFYPQSIAYASGRQRADDEIDKSGIPATIVCPGFVFTYPRSGKIIDTGHHYSPEQLASMFIHLIAGSGKQILQPVYMHDIIVAVFNGLATGKNHLVNAVGPDVFTQEEMLKFFVELVGGRFKPIYIPLDLALIIAKYAPKGRLAPYAIDMLRHLELPKHNTPLCEKEFKNLVGKPLTSMRGLYSNLERSTIVLPKPPILEHVNEILGIIWSNLEARKDCANMMAKHGLPMCVEAVKAILS